jgi:hypothetical protein
MCAWSLCVCRIEERGHPARDGEGDLKYASENDGEAGDAYVLCRATQDARCGKPGRISEASGGGRRYPNHMHAGMYSATAHLILDRMAASGARRPGARPRMPRCSQLMSSAAVIASAVCDGA